MKSGQIMWICENQQYGVFAYNTLAYRRKYCAAMWESSGLTFQQVKSYGWKPVKVRVTIEKIEK